MHICFTRPEWVNLYFRWTSKYMISFWNSSHTLSVPGESPHYNDVIMHAIASQITTLTIVYSTVYSGADQRKHESSASLACNVENVSIWWCHHAISSKYEGPLLLTLISASVNNHMPSKFWNKITYLFPNFNGPHFGVLWWLYNFILHFILDLITYPCWYSSLYMLISIPPLVRFLHALHQICNLHHRLTMLEKITINVYVFVYLYVCILVVWLY